MMDLYFRAINYDEKDPFLCNACGYCKYAKFDFTVTSRPCCAVDPIENEDDRKKVDFKLVTCLPFTHTVVKMAKRLVSLVVFSSCKSPI